MLGRPIRYLGSHTQLFLATQDNPRGTFDGCGQLVAQEEPCSYWRTIANGQ